LVTRPQRADARRNRERLLEAASAAFAERGTEASLEDIARTAGVGIGTLYRHFPTRDALMADVFRRNVDELCDGAEQLLAELPPDEALCEWMQRFVRYVGVKKGLATHLKSVISEDSELFTYSHGRVTGTFESLLQAAKDAGAIRSDVAAEDVLHALSGICMVSAEHTQQQGCRMSLLLMDGLRYRPETAGAATATG
jgi:AcrR family transcriptional regulator